MSDRSVTGNDRHVRRFQFVRKEDESGVSGTGVVAVGAEMPSGRVAIEWLNHINQNLDTSENGWSIYGSIEDAEQVHGHGGRTEIEWLDPDPDYYETEHRLPDELRSLDTDKHQGGPQ